MYYYVARMFATEVSYVLIVVLSLILLTLILFRIALHLVFQSKSFHYTSTTQQHCYAPVYSNVNPKPNHVRHITFNPSPSPKNHPQTISRSIPKPSDSQIVSSSRIQSTRTPIVPLLGLTALPLTSTAPQISRF
mmetsp:Transcript_12080/g.21853  ORF Transcript_12080/g.21853 Transcript_12080/m.21853 type:complete len:134 (+) Transcript_12080:84-485(+)